MHASSAICLQLRRLWVAGHFSYILAVYQCLQVTEGGLMLTSGATTTVSDAVIGEVLSKGEDVDISVSVGDKVIFQKYSSSDVKMPDGEIVFVAQKSVLAVLS